MSVKPISLRMLETLFTCEEAQHEAVYMRRVERPQAREGRLERLKLQKVEAYAPKRR